MKLFAGCLLLFPFLANAIEPERVEVFAGEIDRRNSIVMVRLPGLAGRVVGLRGAGMILPMQVDAVGRGMFILPRLGKGKSVVFKVAPPPEEAKEVKAGRIKEKLRFQFEGRIATAINLKWFRLS